MKFINLSSIIKHRLHVIIILSSVIGTLLITYAFYNVFNSDASNVNKNLTIFNLSSYRSVYNVTVNSNKTSSVYEVEELYRCIDLVDNFRFNYKDFMQNDYSIIISGDKLKIINDLQISRYITKTQNKGKENLYSISTYIDILKDNCFKVSIDETEVTTTYNIYLREILNEELAAKYKEILNSKLDIDRVQLYLVSNRPKNIKAYKNDKELFIIDYLEFIYNDDIDVNMFEV